MKKSIIIATGLLVLSGCAVTSDEPITIEETDLNKFVLTESIIEDKSFIVTHINGEFLPDDLSATIKFGKENRVTGNGFCNLYSGSYSLNYSGELEFDQLLSTRRLCNEDRMEFELLFNNILGYGMSFEQDQLGYKVTSDIGTFKVMEYDAVKHVK